MHDVGEIGGVEATGEDVESVFAHHLAGVELIVDVVGVAVEDDAVFLLQGEEGGDTRGGDVDEDGVEDVVHVLVGERGVGESAHSLAQRVGGEEALFEEIHLAGLRGAGVDVAHVGDAMGEESVGDVLVADVVDDAAKVEDEIFDGCHDVCFLV